MGTNISWLLVLLIPATLLLAICLVLLLTGRRGIAYALLYAAVFAALAAVWFVFAVNLGWVHV